MKVKLTGVQNYDNVKMNDGSILDGTKVFFNYFSPDVKGFAADGKYLSRELLNAFSVTYESLATNIDSEIEIDYGPKNKIVGVSLSNTSKPPKSVQGKIE
jgi:hypothetical protein